MEEKKLFEELKISKGVTAVIGSGGKTSLLYTLALELQKMGSVILTTSTHIQPFAQFPFACSEEELSKAQKVSRIVCVGQRSENGKVVAPTFSIDDRADYVIVEADGARHLPLKAHLSYEPVIPQNANQTIQVVGSHGFNKPIDKVAHRPERFSELLGVRQQEIATPQRIATVINLEGFCNQVLINLLTDVTNEDMEQFLQTIQYPVIAKLLEKY